MESDGKLRLLRLLEILQTESDEQHPISIAEITEMMKERWGLDAYRITVQKDIEALRSAGYEIETIRTTQNRYYLTSRPFELPELKLLLDAVESSKFITQKKSRILASKLLTLTSRHNAAGLKRNISIADNSDVKASAGTDAAAIGTGNECESACGQIDIYKSTVTARGGAYGAAIGGGDAVGGGNIVITHSTVNALGGTDAAGIGGGEGGDGGNIWLMLRHR